RSSDLFENWYGSDAYKRSPIILKEKLLEHMTNRLFVGNISWGATDADLTEAFSKVGTVVSAKIITDKFSGRSKGFGFVEMSSESDRKSAIDQLNDTEIDGRVIKVDFAQEREA